MTRKGDSILRLSTVLLCLVAGGFAAAAWSQEVLRVGPEHEYSTIQAAVDAAHTNAAILVYPSTYPESVSVTKKGLKIIAEGKGVTVGPPPAEGEACFDVKANNVVIEGFDLTGTNCAPAIRFEGSRNRFSDNRIYGLTCPGVNALACRDPDGGSDFNLIQNNDVTEADLGIVITSDSDGAVNRGNVVMGNRVHGVGAVGVVIANGTNCIVSGNVIDGIPFGLGISIIASNKVAQRSHTVTGNRIGGTSEGGIGVFADRTASLSHVTVSHNHIVAPGDYGIVLQKESGATLTGNVISTNWVSRATATGILLDAGVTTNSVLSNLVFDNAVNGIQVSSDHNSITSNTALGNNTFDLADDGKGNTWSSNIYETASWK